MRQDYLTVSRNDIDSIVARLRHSNKKSIEEQELRTALELLEIAYQQNELLESVLNLIEALHPLPRKMGYWNLWVKFLNFAFEACDQHHIHQKARFAEFLCGILYHQSDFDGANRYASLAMQLAIQTDQPDLYVSAGGTVLNVLREKSVQGIRGELDKIFDTLARFDQSAETYQIAFYRWHLYNSVQYRIEGNYRLSLENINHSIEYLKQAKHYDISYEAEALRIRGLINNSLGNHNAARHDLVTAIELYNESGDRDLENWGRANLALTLIRLGEMSSAEMYMYECLEYSQQHNTHLQTIRRVGDLGVIEMYLGRFKASRRYLMEQKELAEEYDQANDYFRATGNLGILSFLEGNYIEAINNIYSELEHLESLGSHNSAAAVVNYLNLARIFHAQDNADSTVEWLEKARQAISLNTSNILRILYHRVHAENAQTREQAIQELYAALELTHKDDYEYLACSLILAHLTKDLEMWDSLINLLEKNGATDSIQRININDMPRLPVL